MSKLKITLVGLAALFSFSLPACDSGGPSEPPLTCAAVTCLVGTTCVEHDGTASCVFDPCAGFECPEGEHCTAPADAPYCEPDSVVKDPCAGFVCPEGEHCTAPADAPYCQPDNAVDPCLAFPCPAGQHCESPDKKHAVCAPNS